MATIFEFKVPPEEFVLPDTLAKLADVEIEIERVVADDPDRITPISGHAPMTSTRLKLPSTMIRQVESLDTLSKMNEERLYQMTGSGSIDQIVPLLTHHEGAVTHAAGSADGRRLRALFPDHEALSEVPEYLREADFSLTIQAVYETKDDGHIQYGLTET